MRTIAILYLLLLACIIQAQSPYRPFPDSDAGWSEWHSWHEPVSDCGDYRWVQCERPVYFGPDSMVEGISYHTLLTHGLCSWGLINPPFPMPPWCSTHGMHSEIPYRAAFIRQDVAERKVYARPPNGGNEELLYDFTIGLGPYPVTLNNPQEGNLHVVALDSMLLNDGWHRTWVLGWMWMGQLTDSAFCHVIEGVGSTLGVLNHIAPPLPYMSVLNCHSVMGSTVYPLGALDCELTVAVLEEEQRHTVRAWPNPATNLIRFTTDLPAGVRYTAFDATGARVGSGTVQHAQLDCSEWPVGLYAITLSDATGGALGAVRVVKE